MKVRTALISFISIVLALCQVPSPAFASDRSVRIQQIKEMRSEQRIALIIGNSSYASSPLKNPVNDARVISKTLTDLGFSIITLENASQKQMKASIDEFGRKLRGGGVGLFYYAGHGMQVQGRNYLIPVDSAISSENDIEYEAVDAGRVLAKMESAGNRLNIVLLDACRDNPFARSFRSSQKGLAYSDAPKGSFIAYATAPGSVAADGKGNNGVFTEEFVKAVQAEGIEIDRVFRQVRASVMARTQEKQVPWTSSSLVGDFFFKMPKDDRSLASSEADPQRPSSPGSVSLEDLEKKAKKLEENKKEWAVWQGQMRQAYDKAKAIETTGLSATDKSEAWKRLVSAYGEDNPFSEDDNAIRSEADQRIRHYEGLMLASKIPSRKDHRRQEDTDLTETKAVIETKFGNMTVKFFPDAAPGHVKNFIDLAKKGFYNGTIFHRVIPGFMIQGGDPTGNGTGGPGYTIKAEFNNKPHKRGILSMARSSNPDSAGSQFFIVVKDSNFLDGQYTVFGEVESGIEVADKIVNAPRNSQDKPNDRIEMQVKIVEPK